MCSRTCDDRRRLTQAAVDFFEALRETEQGSRTDWYVPAHFDIARSEFTRHDAEALAGLRVLDPKQVLGKQFAKTAMDFADAPGAARVFARQSSAVDPLLHRDVRSGFELKIALARILTIVVLKRPFDIDRVSVMVLDEIGVIAVHRTDEVGKRSKDARR